MSYRHRHHGDDEHHGEHHYRRCSIAELNFTSTERHNGQPILRRQLAICGRPRNTLEHCATVSHFFAEVGSSQSIYLKEGCVSLDCDVI